MKYAKPAIVATRMASTFVQGGKGGQEFDGSLSTPAAYGDDE